MPDRNSTFNLIHEKSFNKDFSVRTVGRKVLNAKNKSPLALFGLNFIEKSMLAAAYIICPTTTPLSTLHSPHSTFVAIPLF